MQEQLRILEPLDTNSMSLSGFHSVVSSGNDTDSFTVRDITPLKHGKELLKTLGNEHTPLKWKSQRDEFVFDSNSTPAKTNQRFLGMNSGENRGLDGTRKRKQGQQRRLMLSGAHGMSTTCNSRSALRNHVSKLDLLDDNKITSFPIVPPREAEPSRIRQLTNEYRMNVHCLDRRISLNPRVPDGSEAIDSNELFLIEDYIPRGDETALKGNNKRVSVSDLKSKYYKRKHRDNLPLRLKESNTALSAQAKEVEVLGQIIQPPEMGDQDQYLSNLMVQTSLKHCVICEKPLYELSSRLHDTGKDFQEIVCFGCTSKYEEVAKLLEDYELESTFEDSIDSSRNDSMNSMDFRDPAEVIVSNTNKRLKANNFSSQLIKTLQVVQLQDLHQSLNLVKEPFASSLVDPKTREWFSQAKKKLRWRWRVSGLLPRFLTIFNSDKSLDDE